MAGATAELCVRRRHGDEEFVEEAREKARELEERLPVDIDLKDIVKLVCHEFGMRSERVSQREKSREVSQLRWMIGKLAIEEAGYRLVEVAPIFQARSGGDESWSKAARRATDTGKGVAEES